MTANEIYFCLLMPLALFVFWIARYHWMRSPKCDHCGARMLFPHSMSKDTRGVWYGYCSRDCRERNGDRDNPRRNSGLW